MTGTVEHGHLVERRKPYVVMTDAVDRDPLNVDLCPKSKEEEEYQRLVASVRTSDVDVDAFPHELQLVEPIDETDSSALTMANDGTMDSHFDLSGFLHS